MERLKPNSYDEIIKVALKTGLNKVTTLMKIEVVRSYPIIDEQASLQAALQLGYPAIAKRLLTDPDVRANAAAFKNEALKLAILANYKDIMNDLLTIPAVLKEAQDPACLKSIIKCAFSAGANDEKRNRFEEIFRISIPLSPLSPLPPVLCSQFERMRIRPTTAATASFNTSTAVAPEEKEEREEKDELQSVPPERKTRRKTSYG